jgi:hypothetical protein
MRKAQKQKTFYYRIVAACSIVPAIAIDLSKQTLLGKSFQFAGIRVCSCLLSIFDRSVSSALDASMLQGSQLG